MRGVGEVGVDGVHEPAVDLARSVAQHDEDRDRDEQPHDRIRPVPAERDATGADEHRQRREPVGPGVQAVRDQRCRSDLAADLDAVSRDDLVPEEPDDSRGCDGPEMVHLARVDEATHRLVRRQRG